MRGYRTSGGVAKLPEVVLNPITMSYVRTKIRYQVTACRSRGNDLLSNHGARTVLCQRFRRGCLSWMFIFISNNFFLSQPLVVGADLVFVVFSVHV